MITTTRYIAQGPLFDSIDSACVTYVCGLISAKCFGDIAYTAADVPDLQIVGCETSNNGIALAKGLINIVQWLSFRNWRDASAIAIVQQLCGASKDHKREIGRALKRAVSWVNIWADRSTPVSVQLCDPTCGIILFDKKIRHRNIKYMLECDANCTVKPVHPTIADIHLCMTITAWMAAFTHEKEYILSLIPAIVNYVKSIRAELRCMEYEYCGAVSQFVEYFGDELWVDLADISAGNAHVFKFTQKAKNQKTGVGGGDILQSDAPALLPPAATPLNIPVIELKAQELISLVSWRSAVPLDESTSDRDKSHAAGQESSALDFSCQEDMWEKMVLPPGREVRKTQQINSLLREINTVLPIGGIAVEFCAGGGYVGIPLAVMRPDCTVLLTDMNTVSIQYAKARVERLGLTNVMFLREELAGIEALQLGGDLGVQDNVMKSKCSELELLSKFHVGIALHACGTATDAVLRICTRAGASFVVSPCCYGFLQHQAAALAAASQVEDTSEQVGEMLCQMCVSASRASTCTCTACITPTTSSAFARAPYSSYPASQAFRTCGWEGRWFAALCSQADRTFWSHDARAGANNAKGHLAMRVVDTDRLLAARELGYEVYGTFMWPAEASVKNHILVGVAQIKAL